MVEQELCQNCGQRQSCQAVYEVMSGRKGPSVTLKVIVVFLLPLLVFIGSLLIADKVLADFGAGRELRTVLSFVVATLVTLGWICMIKKIMGVRWRPSGKRGLSE